MVTFAERLSETCARQRSLLCIGLDPDPNLMPIEDVLQFNKAIIDATADLVCAYKPNMAFYEALGMKGLEALEKTVEYIRKTNPDVLIIGDAKRGDIGSSSNAYSHAMFNLWGFDATTVNAFGGHDTIQPFLKFSEKGVFIWCRSSNPGAGDLQDLRLGNSDKDRTVYQHLAVKAQHWNVNGNVGLVVGATYSEELLWVRTMCPQMPILVPGIGAQGGDLNEAVRNSTTVTGNLAIISSSRQILYASQSTDFPHAARQAACRLKNDINAILEKAGKGWS